MEIIIWRFPKIGVPPKSSCFDKVFHYKPYIVGYPHFRKTIYVTFADHGPSEPWQLWVDPMRSSCFNAASVAAEGLSRNGNWQLSTGWRPLDRRCQKTGYTALVNVYVICGYLFKYICIFIETERERETENDLCLLEAKCPIRPCTWQGLRMSKWYGMQIGDGELTHEKKWSFQILGGFYKWGYPPKWRFYNEKSD